MLLDAIMPRHRSTVRTIFVTIALLGLAACTQTEAPRFHPLAGEMSEGQRGHATTALTPSEHTTLVEYALTLINQARTAEGLNPLTLDDNPAAQSHAEASRDACTRGHWGPDGMKPYMRYTLAGGEQYSSENVFAIDFCPQDLDNYDLETPTEQIDFAMDRFLNSPGHRQTILDPHHRKVGIGLTYRPPTIWFVQLFVGDYIEYDTKPTIDSGTLTLSGQTRNGAEISGTSSTLTIYYDPPPQPLTQGQLSRTYCYNNGLRIASIRPPPEYGSAYTQHEATIEVTSSQCPDPHDIPPDAPPPMSNDEAQENWQQARDLSQNKLTRYLTIPLITANEWSVTDDAFNISANITDLLQKHGEGVYTILLWGEINDDRTPISEYSIFVDEQATTQHSLRHIEEKRFMLQLINDERAIAGVGTLELGENGAAQLHAESALANCFGSHWGIDGLKPYMRYSLAGGYQTNSENFYGTDYCITDADDLLALPDIDDVIRDRMAGWLESPEHRLNILDPTHKKVNIGLAWDDYNFIASQHFEGDYVHFDHLPTIRNGVLDVAGELKNEARFQTETDYRVQIYYDQPPRTLTRGQLSRTYCYDTGQPIAGLRPPPDPGSFYTEHEVTQNLSGAPCPDPYDINPETEPPKSNQEAITLWEQARDLSRTTVEWEITYPWITADKWSITDNRFNLSANINNLLHQHGDGIYTVLIWGVINGENTPISQYSIFIPPP